MTTTQPSNFRTSNVRNSARNAACNTPAHAAHPTSAHLVRPMYSIHYPAAICERPLYTIHHPAAICRRPLYAIQHPAAICQRPLYAIHHPAAICQRPLYATHHPATACRRPVYTIHRPRAILRSGIVSYTLPPCNHKDTSMYEPHKPLSAFRGDFVLNIKSSEKNLTTKNISTQIACKTSTSINMLMQIVRKTSTSINTLMQIARRALMSIENRYHPAAAQLRRSCTAGIDAFDNLPDCSASWFLAPEILALCNQSNFRTFAKNLYY